MTSTVTRVLTAGLACAESPRWHQGELFFSDMYGRCVHAVTESGAVRTVAEVPDVPTGLGWLPDGRLLVATQRRPRVLRLEHNGSLAVHAELGDVTTSNLNDMWVDTGGRAYVGELGFDSEAVLRQLSESAASRDEAVTALIEAARWRPGRVHLVLPDGTHRLVNDTLVLPNGMALSADGAHLYAVASLEPAVHRFNVTAEGDLAGDTVVVVPTSPPDGMSADDSEGGFWVALPEEHAAIRVGADGQPTDRVETDRKCLAVALGGSTGRTLFLATTISNDDEESVTQRASRIESIQVRVPLSP